MSTYYIASLKHTHKGDEHIVWWGTNHCGYTPVLGERAGRYCYGEACELNDGRDRIAVPADAVQKLMSPEPYFENSTGLHRWYDQRGPVVLNTLANWRALQAARLLPERGQGKPKPEVFRGKRRAIYSAGELQALLLAALAACGGGGDDCDEERPKVRAEQPTEEPPCKGIPVDQLPAACGFPADGEQPTPPADCLGRREGCV